MKTLSQSKILFAGPLPPPVTGQAFSFKETISIIECKEKYIVNQNFEGDKIFIKWFKTLWLLPKYLALFLFKKIDLVYFTGTRSFQGSVKDLMLIFLSSLFGKKTINHIHGADFKDFVNGLPRAYQRLLLFAYRRIDCHIILLEEMRAEIDSFLHYKKISVISNFYDPVLDTIPFTQKNEEEMAICYFSNLMYSKGILDVLEAFNKLDKRFGNVKLLLAGQYMSDNYMTDREVQEKVSIEVNNNSRIKFYGVLKNEEKVSFLSSSHIFVLPSFYRSEALPISVIEAMRCGCVLICADHNYIKGVVNPQHGSLIEARDIEGLCNAMEKYLGDPSGMKRLAEDNRNYAKENFSIDRYKVDMNKLFQSVLYS